MLNGDLFVHKYHEYIHIWKDENLYTNSLTIII